MFSAIRRAHCLPLIHGSHCTEELLLALRSSVGRQTRRLARHSRGRVGSMTTVQRSCGRSAWYDGGWGAEMKQSRSPLVVAVVLLLLPVLYVGSYLALVTPKGQRVVQVAPNI